MQKYHEDADCSLLLRRQLWLLVHKCNHNQSDEPSVALQWCRKLWLGGLLLGQPRQEVELELEQVHVLMVVDVE